MSRSWRHGVAVRQHGCGQPQRHARHCTPQARARRPARDWWVQAGAQWQHAVRAQPQGPRSGRPGQPVRSSGDARGAADPAVSWCAWCWAQPDGSVCVARGWGPKVRVRVCTGWRGRRVGCGAGRCSHRHADDHGKLPQRRNRLRWWHTVTHGHWSPAAWRRCGWSHRRRWWLWRSRRRWCPRRVWRCRRTSRGGHQRPRR